MKTLFQNQTVATIAIVALTALALGILLILSGIPALGKLGMAMSFLAVCAMVTGWTHFGADPLIGGVLTTGGQIAYDKDGNTTTMRGYVILAPYFLIQAVRVPLDTREWPFNMEVLSSEPVAENAKPRQTPIDGGVFMTVEPDDYNMGRFVKAGGNLDKIKFQFDKIVYQETQRVINSKNNRKGLSAIEITQSGYAISTELELLAKQRSGPGGLYEKLQDFGIRCKQIQVDFKLPEQVKKSMLDATSIQYESSARASENDADIAAAKELRRQFPEMTDAQAWDKMLEARLLRGNQIQRLQFETKGTSITGAVIVRDPNIHMSGKK